MSEEKPEVSLAPVTRENFRECVGLKVAWGQKDFVAPNVYSIAQSAVEPGCVPLAVYADEKMVGFAMYELDPEDGEYSIDRFMISEENQRKGYGRAGMEALIEVLEKKPDCERIYISWTPENVVAAKLYRDLGFVETGEIEDGEVVARLDLG